jgi:putative transposase
VRYRFIDSQAGQHPIGLLCRVLAVSRAGYYAWRKRPPSQRTMANQKLQQAMWAVYDQSRQTYGYRRVHAAVQGQIACNHKRVARLLRAAGWQAKRSRRYRVTTQSNPSHPTAPNRLGQVFVAAQPDQIWLSDITYIRTGEGWLYLAAVLDLYARRIVGWAMGTRLQADLTLKALQMALLQRRPQEGLIHHSDRGSKYNCHDYQALLSKHKALPSMSRVGNAYDNAPMESFFATLKTELVHHCRFHTREQAQAALFDYMEIFYNRQRIHSALSYRTPTDFEALYRAA